jgi:hypothetical protein
MLEVEIRQAVMELKVILEQLRQSGSTRRVTQPDHVEAAGDVVIDPATMEQVDSMFARAPKQAGKEQAEEFWESMGEKGMTERKTGRDVLSYDEARDLGLAPDEGKPA